MNNKMLLKNWTITRMETDAVIVFGNIYGDIHHRFLDGTYIHTSKVLRADFINKKIETMNNTYYLE